MTYTAGTSGLSAFGVPDGVPRITCNGCGLVYRLPPGPPPAWFLNGKPKPGWSLTGRGTTERRDLCPRCKPQKKGPAR